METWLLLHLQCFLIGGLVDSSPLTSASRPGSVSTQVGLQVVLPCSWKSHVVGVDGSTCHIQWTNPEDTVFEQQGVRTWQADNFEGRLAVPQDQLGSGNCSLIISDTQIGDAGSYDSFVVVDGVRAKTRVFIQTVTLLVFGQFWVLLTSLLSSGEVFAWLVLMAVCFSLSDHKALQSRGSGEDWVLELHTRHSVRVIFQGRNSSEWTDLWMRGDTNSERVEKHPHKEQLTIKNLQSLDEGLYKVLDKRGLAISTVQLTVAGSSKSSQVEQVLQSRMATGDASKSSCSALLIASLLVTSFQIPHV
ncbi:galectin 17 isoform X1 [Betta splendens]|uniref:Galectin 17 isoform X1 n=1 Tax=Betta splendens TaxID=158456 RepID=A0A6P7NUV0_BETSP|nr:galectin 17 isoform X1 [Betta splendens]